MLVSLYHAEQFESTTTRIVAKKSGTVNLWRILFMVVRVVRVHAELAACLLGWLNEQTKTISFFFAFVTFLNKFFFFAVCFLYLILLFYFLKNSFCKSLNFFFHVWWIKFFHEIFICWHGVSFRYTHIHTGNKES